MSSFLNQPDWLWVPVVLFAALAQTFRNTAQRSLTTELGIWPATLVRFLYGLPFALVYLAALYLFFAPARLLPAFSWAYVAWIGFGAAFQIGATAALLLAMRERNFAVAVTLAKTEVLQVALFALMFLHELPTALGLLAMVLATLGVVVLSLPARGQWLSLSAWLSRPALYGLAAGAGFALATVCFRGGALALNAESPWVSSAWGVLLAQGLQSLAMGAWVSHCTPQGLAPLWRAWRVSLLTGAMGAAASIAWFTGYALQSVGNVRTLGMVEVVFSYLVSRRVLREPLSWPEKIGMLLMLCGLVLVTLE